MSTNDKKYADMESTLSAIGKEVFVNFYYDFKNMNIKDDELAEKLYRENRRSKSTRQGFRIPRARHIFENGQEIQALQIIIASKKIGSDTKDKARILLGSACTSQKIDEDTNSENHEIFLQDINKQLIYSSPESFEYDNQPKSPNQQMNVSVKKYKRSRTVSKNALFQADYLCEVDRRHPLFKRKNSNINYTEPHHLIPLSAADDFPDIDLDREQNVVSLCSSCHNMLHYGADAESVLKPLFIARIDLLKAIGIDITFEQLAKYYK